MIDCHFIKSDYTGESFHVRKKVFYLGSPVHHSAFHGGGGTTSRKTHKEPAKQSACLMPYSFRNEVVTVQGSRAMLNMLLVYKLTKLFCRTICNLLPNVSFSFFLSRSHCCKLCSSDSPRSKNVLANYYCCYSCPRTTWKMPAEIHVQGGQEVRLAETSRSLPSSVNSGNGCVRMTLYLLYGP
jgi:hypothetical protein